MPFGDFLKMLWGESSTEEVIDLTFDYESGGSGKFPWNRIPIEVRVIAFHSAVVRLLCLLDLAMCHCVLGIVQVFFE